MKKLSIIGTVGIPANFGGFETLTEHIVQNLSRKFNITVFCSSKSYTDKTKEFNSAKRIFIPLSANGIQSIFYDIVSIIIALFKSDTLLILGVSGCTILPIIRPFHNKKLIVSIDGLEWKRDKWSKFAKWFLKLSEKCAVNTADTIIADNLIIQEYIRFEYNKDSELIEYGGDQSIYIKPTVEHQKEYTFLNEPYALSISRIEPENNCKMILEAFALMKRHTLVYIGNWGKNIYSSNLKQKYKSNANIILLDAIYNIETLNVIRSNCTIYVHGHSVGGTNPALVEAMYVGLPIIAYDVNFNRVTTKNVSSYFKDIEQLLKNFELFINDRKSLQKVSIDLKKEAKIHYKWKDKINKYAEIF